jgi:hypothetical protein
MIKKILKLEGVHELNKKESKAISGAGFRRCCEFEYNASGQLVCTFWIGQGQYCP